MPRGLLPVLIGVLIALIFITNTAFVVRQDRQAIVLRFGQYVRTINPPSRNEPGLYFKVPFAENVIIYDRRNLGLTFPSQQIVASDPDTRDMFFEPAEDKVYRHPTFYKLPADVDHM